MHKKILYLCYVLLIAISGCVMPKSNNDPASAIENLNPDIEKVCQSNPRVSMNELGLPNNLVLLSVQQDEILGGNLGTPLHSDILSYSGKRSIPSKIEDILSSDRNSKIINILVSPRGLRLAIFRWNANDNHETLWVSTLDGQKQWLVADISPRQRVFWVSENEILVVGVPNETDYEGRIPEEEMRPLLSINPFTSDTRQLETLPEGAIYVYNSYHSRDGKPYSMYYKDDSQRRNYFLYDYAKGTPTHIFRWIDMSDPTIGVGIRSNGLYYVARKAESGVDFAIDLNLEQIAEDKNYTDIMKRFSITSGKNHEISTMLFNWMRTDIPILTSDPLDDQRSTPIYLFDYRANVLRDYCINLGLALAVFSPDEQFAAFTVNEGMETLGYHVLILNLKTGYYSIIEDTKAIGFGKVN